MSKVNRTLTVYDCDEIIHEEPWTDNDKSAMKWVEIYFPRMDWSLVNQPHRKQL